MLFGFPQCRRPCHASSGEIIAAAPRLRRSSGHFGGQFSHRPPFADCRPSVQIVATFSVGYEHINLKAARDRGIAITNTPDVLTDATADIAMLLILGAARGASLGRTDDARGSLEFVVADLSAGLTM